MNSNNQNIDQTQLFNLINPVETRPEFLINFYAGNILSIPADILVLSAYINGYAPTPKTIFGDLKEQYDFLIDTTKLVAVSRNIRMLDVAEHRLPYRKLVIVEMSEIGAKLTHGQIVLIFNEIKQNILNLANDNDRSVSFPLLGTGNQGLSKETVTLELLKLSRELAASKLEQVNIFAYGNESIGILNLSLNASLHQKQISTSNNIMLQAIKEELDMIIQAHPEHFLDEMTRLTQLITAPNVSIEPIAIHCRIICEAYSKKILESHNIEFHVHSTLESRIQQLKPLLLGNKPYVLSYLRLLQSCGNIAAHESSSVLTNHDLIAILLSVIRVFHSLPV